MVLFQKTNKLILAYWSCESSIVRKKNYSFRFVLVNFESTLK